jgi:predicted TPR repeat methyltransferase
MSEDRVSRARSITSAQEAAEVYRDWAATYDDDVFGRLGFVGSAHIAELLVAHLPDRSVPVLDLGCGTGAVGIRLAELGVTTVDGVDLSPEMLAVAERAGVYRTLAVVDLTAADVDLADLTPGAYGAAVSAGTFTSGHVGPDAVPRLLRTLTPGGLIAWVIGGAVWPSFEPVLSASALTVLHEEWEPIRRDGPPEAVMLVARRDRPGTSGARSA